MSQELHLIYFAAKRCLLRDNENNNAHTLASRSNSISLWSRVSLQCESFFLNERTLNGRVVDGSTLIETVCWFEVNRKLIIEKMTWIETWFISRLRRKSMRKYGKIPWKTFVSQITWDKTHLEDDVSTSMYFQVIFLNFRIILRLPKNRPLIFSYDLSLRCAVNSRINANVSRGYSFPFAAVCFPYLYYFTPLVSSRNTNEEVS